MQIYFNLSVTLQKYAINLVLALAIWISYHCILCPFGIFSLLWIFLFYFGSVWVFIFIFFSITLVSGTKKYSGLIHLLHSFGSSLLLVNAHSWPTPLKDCDGKDACLRVSII